MFSKLFACFRIRKPAQRPKPDTPPELVVPDTPPELVVPDTPPRDTNRRESNGERECRRVLTEFFDTPFLSVRPDMLRNPVTGCNLEIDCYSAKLKLAIEYNGAQHYKYTKRFHDNKEAFMCQRYRDELKLRMCRDAGITLIAVPYTIPIKDIEKYLAEQLQDSGFAVPP